MNMAMLDPQALGKSEIRVVSLLPGRIRLKLDNGCWERLNFDDLIKIKGLTRLELNRISGSLLILHDASAISHDAVLSEVSARLGQPVPRLAEQPLGTGQNGQKPIFQVVHHSTGRLRLKSHVPLDNHVKVPDAVQAIFSLEGIKEVRVNPFLNTLLVLYDSSQARGDVILDRIHKNVGPATPISPVLVQAETTPEAEEDSQTGCHVYTRTAEVVSNFQVVSDLPGRLRIKHPVLFLRSAFCERLRLDLGDTVGIEDVRANSYSGTLLINYNRKEISKEKIIAVCEELMTAMPGECLKKDDTEMAPFFLSSLSFGASFFVAPPLAPFSFALILFTGLPIFQKAIDSIRNRKVTVDILDSIVITGALAMGALPIAAFMVWILDVADALLAISTKQSQAILGSVFSGKASFAYVIKDGAEVRVAVKKIEEGDIVVVSTGERIPVDGVLSDGEGTVDQQIITGEAAPVEKYPGDKVYTSTMVLAGKIFIKAENVGENTIEAKIGRIIAETAKFEPKILSKGMEFANRMVIPTLALGSLGLAVGGPSAALAILNADFGTGIRVAAPTALLSYLAVAAKHGIVIKNGKCLENLLKVDTFLFDKTGTLTKEIPKVAKVACNKGYDENKVLAFAAAAEERFTHPLARAIVHRAKELNLPHPRMDESQYHVGFGIHAVIEGIQVKIGSMRFMQKEGIDIPKDIRRQVDASMQKGGCGVMVSFDDVLAGGLILESSERLEAAELIQMLKKRGRHVILISGDHEAPTRVLSERLGIEEYYYEKLPHEKADFLRNLQAQGKKVAMVGDGVNDSIALSLADTSVSLRGASDIAVDVADVVFMDGSLTKLEALIDIAEGLDKTIKKCFKMIVLPNSLCIAGALFGVVQLGVSLILNNVFNIAASINATLPLRHLHDDEDTFGTPVTEKKG